MDDSILSGTATPGAMGVVILNVCAEAVAANATAKIAPSSACLVMFFSCCTRDARRDGESRAATLTDLQHPNFAIPALPSGRLGSRRLK
jgi:hypothetical protein